MSSTFFYTFRTNKFVTEIERVLGQKVYVIDRPAKDFAKLLSAIDESGADLVVGIGIVRAKSRWERFCYNQIGKNRISDDAPDRLSLENPSSKTPAFAGMTIDGKGMTFGFCNYVAFRIASETKLRNGFLHLRKEDINKLQAVAV